MIRLRRDASHHKKKKQGRDFVDTTDRWPRTPVVRQRRRFLVIARRGRAGRRGRQGLSSGRTHGAPVAASGKGTAFPFPRPQPLRGDGSRNRQNYWRRRRSPAQNLGKNDGAAVKNGETTLPRRRNWKKEGAEVGRRNGSKWGELDQGSGGEGSRGWCGESSAGLKRSTPRDEGAGVMRFSAHAFLFWEESPLRLLMSASAFARRGGGGQESTRQGKAPRPCCSCSCSEISGDVGPLPCQLLIWPCFTHMYGILNID